MRYLIGQKVKVAFHLTMTQFLGMTGVVSGFLETSQGTLFLVEFDERFHEKALGWKFFDYEIDKI